MLSCEREPAIEHRTLACRGRAALIERAGRGHAAGKWRFRTSGGGRPAVQSLNQCLLRRRVVSRDYIRAWDERPARKVLANRSCVGPRAGVGASRAVRKTSLNGLTGTPDNSELL